MKAHARAFVAVALFSLMGYESQACVGIDFLDLQVPHRSADPVRDVIQLSYPDIEFSADGSHLTVNGSNRLAVGQIRSVSPEERLGSPAITEQFFYTYPLAFDLAARQAPYFDPGRVRNMAFFKALYFENGHAAAQHLVAVSEPQLSPSSFRVTTWRSVACQLRHALTAVADADPGLPRFFKAPGGGFNWRPVSGTNRLSPHSFGIAIDIKPGLGQYWKWTGARPGAVGDYENQVPELIVATMERFGFIRGGKWHHFDGMHFEYRPELILHSRIRGGG